MTSKNCSIFTNIFRIAKKIHQIDTDSDLLTIEDDSLYLYVNNDIVYGLFED